MKSTHITKKIFIAFIFIGLCTGAGWAAEDLFLLDSRPGQDGSDIYRVTLDAMSGHGNLTLIRNVPVDESYALACTQDGERCYAIAKHTADFGYLDLGDNTWYSLPTVWDADVIGDIVPEIVLAAFSPDGELFVASQSNESIYIIDVETGIATLVGQVEEDVARTTVVDIGGADMAFKADGQLCLWTNSTQTMYTLTLPDTYPGIVIATIEFNQPGTFVTGLAFRANGYGGPIGSLTNIGEPAGQRGGDFLVTDGDPFPMYLDGDEFIHAWGDMANGSMDLCTLTIGYYKNHDWEGGGVHVCGVPVGQGYGQEILSNARGNNFSMLFAQLIAAKLNVNDAGGIAVIDDAEAWLCEQANAAILDDDVVVDLDWDAKFNNKTQKGLANSYKDPLDDFNNSNHCD